LVWQNTPHLKDPQNAKYKTDLGFKNCPTLVSLGFKNDKFERISKKPSLQQIWVLQITQLW
jgi:hypothetical protein